MASHACRCLFHSAQESWSKPSGLSPSVDHAVPDCITGAYLPPEGHWGAPRIADPRNQCSCGRAGPATEPPQRTAPWFDQQTSEVAVPLQPAPRHPENSAGDQGCGGGKATVIALGTILRSKSSRLVGSSVRLGSAEGWSSLTHRVIATTCASAARQFVNRSEGKYSPAVACLRPPAPGEQGATAKFLRSFWRTLILRPADLGVVLHQAKIEPADQPRARSLGVSHGHRKLIRGRRV